LKFFAFFGRPRVEPHADGAQEQQADGERAAAAVIRWIFIEREKDFTGIDVNARRDADQCRGLERFESSDE